MVKVFNKEKSRFICLNRYFSLFKTLIQQKNVASLSAKVTKEIIEKKHKSLQNVNCLFCQLLKILNSCQNFCFFCGKTNLFRSLFAVLELFNQSIKHQKSKNKN